MDNDLSGIGRVTGKEQPKNRLIRNLRNNGEKYVTVDAFDTYVTSQEKLCSAYREHQKDLIEGIRDEIKNAIYLTTSIIGLIVTVSTIIMMVVRGG